MSIMCVQKEAKKWRRRNTSSLQNSYTLRKKEGTTESPNGFSGHTHRKNCDTHDSPERCYS